MFSMNLYGGYRVGCFIRAGACWLPLLLLASTAGWHSPALLAAGEPPVDGSAAVSPAEETSAVKNALPPAAAPAESAAVDGAGQNTTDARATAGTSVPTTGKRRGQARRLPTYYGTVVDGRQRSAIYEIRARYEVQLEQLQQQLDAIRQAERAQIDALLTAEQLQRIAALRAQRTEAAKPAEDAAPR